MYIQQLTSGSPQQGTPACLEALLQASQFMAAARLCPVVLLRLSFFVQSWSPPCDAGMPLRPNAAVCPAFAVTA